MGAFELLSYILFCDLEKAPFGKDIGDKYGWQRRKGKHESDRPATSTCQYVSQLSARIIGEDLGEKWMVVAVGGSFRVVDEKARRNAYVQLVWTHDRHACVARRLFQGRSPCLPLPDRWRLRRC